MQYDTPSVIGALRHILTVDKEYRDTWVANIAMSFYDACVNSGVKPDNLHELCNKAADNFLDTLVNCK